MFHVERRSKAAERTFAGMRSFRDACQQRRQARAAAARPAGVAPYPGRSLDRFDPGGAGPHGRPPADDVSVVSANGCRLRDRRIPTARTHAAAIPTRTTRTGTDPAGPSAASTRPAPDRSGPACVVPRAGPDLPSSSELRRRLAALDLVTRHPGNRSTRRSLSPTVRTVPRDRRDRREQGDRETEHTFAPCRAVGSRVQHPGHDPL